VRGGHVEHQRAARGLAGAEVGEAQILVAAGGLEGVAIALIEVVGAVLGVEVARVDVEPPVKSSLILIRTRAVT
jgi:hypothetical protein